jgi:hypothetical protein
MIFLKGVNVTSDRLSENRGSKKVIINEIEILSKERRDLSDS